MRCGLCKALADVLIVLKFDRLSRSTANFCELYETYFKDGTKGTGGDSGIDPARFVAGRALWESLVFAADGTGSDRRAHPKGGDWTHPKEWLYSLICAGSGRFRRTIRGM